MSAVQEGSDGADLVTKCDLAEQTTELRIQIAQVRSEMRELEQRLPAKIEAANAALLNRLVGLILGAVLVNVVAVLGAMFAAVKLMAH